MNALFGSVVAAVVPAAAALSFPSAEADPIFAASEAHRAASIAFEAESDDPEEDNWPSMGTERDTHIAVLTTVPTTASGIAAVLEYAGSPYRLSSDDDCILTKRERFAFSVANQSKTAVLLYNLARNKLDWLVEPINSRWFRAGTVELLNSIGLRRTFPLAACVAPLQLVVRKKFDVIPPCLTVEMDGLRWRGNRERQKAHDC